MRLSKYIVFACAILCFSTAASAEKITVQTVPDEGVEMSTMELRQKAQDEAFARAVQQEALKLLPAPLAVERQELLYEYFLKKAASFVQGYRDLGSQDTEDGLSLTLDVNVNRKNLREYLQKMGIYYTVTEPLPVTFRHKGELDEETKETLDNLITLTGLKRDLDVLPEFLLEREGEKLWRGRLVLADTQWIAVKKDIPEVWDDLWQRYFSRREMQEKSGSATFLRVSGWFTPDGVDDFDRVLQGWVSAVEDVKLVELEMLPSGVSATWEVDVVNEGVLESRLQAFLPGRGLSYGLSLED